MTAASRPPDYVIEAARLAGVESPCAKSKRGAVLFKAEDAERLDALDRVFVMDHEADRRSILVARGFNGPPPGFTCAGDMRCRSACSKLCIHAEQRAILKAVGADDVVDIELVHVKVIAGAVQAGGPPSCVECSRLCVEVGLRGVWLFEGTRWHDEVRCKACRKTTIIPQGEGTTGVCTQCDEVYRLLELPGKRIYDQTSGEWRCYSAADFHRTTLRNLGIAPPEGS